MSAALRPDIREQLGVAFGSSSLSIEGRTATAETALQRVAALGAATLHVQHGADRKGEPIATVIAMPGHAPDPQDLLAANLGAMLWHIRFGRQHELVGRAVPLFAAWLGYRGRMVDALAAYSMDGAAQNALLQRFAARAMHEWLSDRCIACAGSGKLERSASGNWIRPRGSMQRNAVFRVCPACNGTRHQVQSHTGRAVALGLTGAQYESGHWSGIFRASRIWLGRCTGRVRRPLTAQLERRHNRI